MKNSCFISKQCEREQGRRKIQIVDVDKKLKRTKNGALGNTMGSIKAARVTTIKSTKLLPVVTLIGKPLKRRMVWPIVSKALERSRKSEQLVTKSSW